MNILCRLGLHRRWRDGYIDGVRGPWQELTDDGHWAVCLRCRQPRWRVR
jgi:hypothetical protein